MRISRLMKVLIGTGAMIAIAAPSCVPASAPSASGSFIACYKTAGGAVRFVNQGEACDPGENQATWSQTGPAGPAGPAGTNGINGNGPAYHDATSSSQTIVHYTAGATTVATLNVPAGNYSVDFTAGVFRYSNGAPSVQDYIQCSLSSGISRATGSSLSVDFDGALAFHTVRNFAGGPMTVGCKNAGDALNVYRVYNVEFTATAITGIIEQ